MQYSIGMYLLEQEFLHLDSCKYFSSSETSLLVLALTTAEPAKRTNKNIFK